MDILTKPLSLLFRPRAEAIRHFAGRTVALQEKQLAYLLTTARETEWGKQHRFRQLKGYSDFREAVPLSCYDDLKPYISRMVNGERNVLWPSAVHWYAKSSGTTADKSKFIPVTYEILHRCHYQGGFDSLALYLRNHPDSHLFAGKELILGGSHSPSPLNASAHCGDLSAVLLQNLNPLVNLIRTPSKRIILMDEWESKLQAIVAHTRHEDVRSLAGVPSWMLTLIKALLREAGKESLTEIWPNLEVFFHGGISFDPYREQYKALIPSSKMYYMETYNASEGFFGIQDDPADRSLLLMPDYGIFYEFIPMEELEKEDPAVFPLASVETGRNYAMVISTCGGLWRCLLGDTVRFTSLHPYKFVITGRTKHYINAFGEELMVGNADKAIAEACHRTGAKVKEYTAAPLFLLDHAKGRHQWLIEFEKAPASLPAFTEALDDALKAANSDYEAKRYKEISLQMPEVIAAREGLFYDWLKEEGKLGGQHKIPRLSNDRSLLEKLLAKNGTPGDSTLFQ